MAGWQRLPVSTRNPGVRFRRSVSKTMPALGARRGNPCLPLYRHATVRS